MSSTLIGTGFYASEEDHDQEYRFFQSVWVPNTGREKRLVVVTNSHYCPLLPKEIRVYRNLGHVDNSPFATTHKLLGWSMSWIMPAMVAYSEGLDFIYKEQDCLVFGDWMQAICHGDACFGRNSVMGCEQSLFYIRHGFILDFVTAYMSLPQMDAKCTPENKFMILKERFSGIEQFDMPCGRERPLPLERKTWYAQRLTPVELDELRKRGLI
jgi:hypothetical protein